ncbi:hypothetical protein JCM8097_006018 [Rhodosporidiobolus ruineniae]
MASSPSYVPYTPKRHGTSSSISSLPRAFSPSTPPSSSPFAGGTTSRAPSSLGGPPSALVTDAGGLKAPQPSRPALPSQWSGLSGSSGAPAPPQPPSQAASSPSSPPPRPTPSPAFPFSTVPPGQSPFGTPHRAQSPDKRPAAALQQQQQQGGGSSSSSRAASPGGARGKMPYRPGFQPQGVRVDRSDEFFEKRRGKSEARKLDEARLARRLEKLVALHFPEPSAKPALTPSKESPLASLSSFGDSLRTRTAKELWRSVASNVDVDIERAEQSIVKWQADKDATHCPICTAAFGVRVRRHHCRLCGRVVCFLPPTPLSAYPPTSPPLALPDAPPAPPKPFRRERCSTFFTYEYQTLPGAAGGGAEKKPTGVVVEVPPVEQDLSIDGMLGAPGGPAREKEHDERKKVRVCRDCLNTVLRQQLKTLPVRTPTWLKLYEVLVQLEKEIDATLPEFEELAITLQNPASAMASAAPPSAAHAKSLRKRLLTDLASYDTISKRIRDLPLPPSAPVGGSQDRLQRALAARGTLYLSEKLGLLRSLGNVEELGGNGGGKKKDKEKEKEEPHTVKTLASLLGKEEMDKVNEKVGPELEAAAQLQVLLEQEALVKSYVDDANSRRQFEDAAALQMSLDELRAEIQRLSEALP